jgi:hypothetical protein
VAGKVIPFPKRPPELTAETGLVEIHRCIPTLLRSRLTQSVHPFSVGSQGEIVVMVPEAEAGRSRLLLARVAPGPSLP